MRGLIGASLLAVSAIAFGQGNNCDCQQIVGTCSVSVSVIPTESTKGSYGADLKITSSAPTCSKVDYFVDGTPYFTILSRGNRGEDRVFGQKPITRANISGIACHVCKVQPAPGNADSNRQEGNESVESQSSNGRAEAFLQGTWCSDTGSVHTVIKVAGSNVTFAASYEGGPPSHNSGVLVPLGNDEFEFRRGNGTDRFRLDGSGFRWIGRNGGASPYPENLAYRCAG
ncbi:hypothetical protein PPN31119_03230 [Pandoraea pnomenusa]|uniref:Uncharacterized protein n=1 Tax=Pandoraea pnomenusa TaxID=93220 RepID=A0ABY6WM98_9BURK|nr:hypothetical protein PPN31119_03230 [Pandoraea pnomenusa]